MPIIVNLDVIMAKRKIGLIELAEKINIRFSTLEEICKALDCQPSDILEYVKE